MMMNPPILYSEKTSEFYLEKAELQYKAEMYDNSLYNAKRALTLNEDLYQAENLLGNIYVKKNNRLDAIDHFNNSLIIKNDQPKIHATIGELYEFFHEYELAFEHFEKAIALEPENIAANIHIVRYYVQANQPQLAQKHFEICYGAGKKLALPYYSEGTAKEEEGDTMAAEDLYLTAISKNPAMVEAYYSLYNMYRKQNNYDGAIEVMEKLIYVKPDHEMAFVSLGHLYLNRKMGKYRELYLKKSIKYLKKALEINPDNYECYFLLSEAYEIMGEELEAEAMEDKAFELQQKENSIR